MFGRPFASSNGKKALAALSGGFLAGWLVLHVLGNLTVFAGPGRMDGYAAALRRTGPLLFLVRTALVVSLFVHVLATVSLARAARRARPLHAVWRPPRGSTSSRTMIFGGPLLAAFVGYHLLHLTFGVVHPSFEPGLVYSNVVKGLSVPAVAAVYVAGALLAGLHLHHGLRSALVSLGAWPATSHAAKALSAAVAVAIALCLAAVPVAVAARVVR